MMNTLVGLLKKYKSLILYLFFGVATTVVNLVVYYLCSHVLQLSTVVSTCVAWFLAVVFAYVTNRKWVFESKAKEFKDVLREIISFFSCRLATGILDVVIMYVCVDVLQWNDVVIKLLSNVLVIVLNYVASKLLIFTKRD